MTPGGMFISNLNCVAGWLQINENGYVSSSLQMSVTSNRIKIWFNCTLIKLVQSMGRKAFIGFKMFLRL